MSLTSWMQNKTTTKTFLSQTYPLETRPHFDWQTAPSQQCWLQDCWLFEETIFLTPHAPALVQPSSLSSGRTRQHGSVTVSLGASGQSCAISSWEGHKESIQAHSVLLPPPHHNRAQNPVLSAGVPTTIWKYPKCSLLQTDWCITPLGQFESSVKGLK